MQISINDSTCGQAYSALLNDLLEETFGLSLAPWFTTWGWPADYTCFSVLENAQVIANASVYRMELLVNGGVQEWLQLGAVATRKDRRGEGLSRRLLESIFSRFPKANFFLCANESVVDFYPRFGFQRIPSWQPVLDIADHVYEPAQNIAALRKIQLNDPRVRQYLTGPRHRSQILDCNNAAPLHWFHLLMTYSDCIYEIPHLHTLLVARQEGSILELAGVWTCQPLTFMDLAPALAFPGVKTIRFGFQPDWLDVDYQMVERMDDPLFIRGSWPNEQRAILSDLIRT
jgi:GNAT superfamily N-acetyltransferase